MKRFMIALSWVLLLSGCHSGKFQYDNSELNLETELSRVIDVMLDEGKYKNDLMVPYDRASLSIDYSRNTVVVEAVQFQVYRRPSGNEHQYDSTACFDEDGRLLCKEERGKYTSTERVEEVSLVDTMDNYSEVDVDVIVSELREHFSITMTESTLVILHLAIPSDINDEVNESDNVVFYYDDSFHYDSTYTPEDMMVEIKVHFFGDGTGETYIVYMEIE